MNVFTLMQYKYVAEMAQLLIETLLSLYNSRVLKSRSNDMCTRRPRMSLNQNYYRLDSRVVRSSRDIIVSRLQPPIHVGRL